MKSISLRELSLLAALILLTVAVLTIGWVLGADGPLGWLSQRLLTIYSTVFPLVVFSIVAFIQLMRSGFVPEAPLGSAGADAVPSPETDPDPPAEPLVADPAAQASALRQSLLLARSVPELERLLDDVDDARDAWPKQRELKRLQRDVRQALIAERLRRGELPKGRRNRTPRSGGCRRRPGWSCSP